MTVWTGLEQRPTQVIWIAFDAERRTEEGHILPEILLFGKIVITQRAVHLVRVLNYKAVLVYVGQLLGSVTIAMPVTWNKNESC